MGERKTHRAAFNQIKFPKKLRQNFYFSLHVGHAKKVFIGFKTHLTPRGLIDCVCTHRSRTRIFRSASWSQGRKKRVREMIYHVSCLSSSQNDSNISDVKRHKCQICHAPKSIAPKNIGETIEFHNISKCTSIEGAMN